MRQSTDAATIRKVPRVERLVEMDTRIEELRRQQRRVLQTIVADCEFMDVPVARIPYYAVDDHSYVRLGSLCHVVRRESERRGGLRDDLLAHPAENCDHPWCKEEGARIKFPKRCHVGDRTFYTRQADAVCVGIEERTDELIWRKGALQMFTFVPVVTPKWAAA